jgi:hypothetical protein
MINLKVVINLKKHGVSDCIDSDVLQQDSRLQHIRQAWLVSLSNPQ